MSEISYTIDPANVEWEMDWSQTDTKGNRKWPDKPEKEKIFEVEEAVALLLINEVIFLNSHHWEKEWPDRARKTTSLNVNCSDIFAWGCADAEEICVDDEIEDLYRMWKDNPTWGSALWCMMKRREMPQKPVEEDMRKDDVDLDAFQKEHNLRNNFYSGHSAAQAKFKYECYSEWARSTGKKVLPFDAGWWNGWKDFIKANPDWEEQVGKEAYTLIRNQFIKDNDWEGEASNG